MNDQIFKYFERYDVHENVITAYEQKIVSSEDVVEIVDTIIEMFQTLMNSVNTTMHEYMDISEHLSSSNRGVEMNNRHIRNIKDTVNQYETELKKYNKAMVEQANYITILEGRLKEKDKMIMTVQGEKEKIKMELKLITSWSKRGIRDVKESAPAAVAFINPSGKILKKTTSAKIFKGSDLDLNAESSNMKVADRLILNRKKRCSRILFSIFRPLRNPNLNIRFHPVPRLLLTNPHSFIIINSNRAFHISVEDRSISTSSKRNSFSLNSRADCETKRVAS